MTSWNGVPAPAGTPPAVISRLHATLLETLRTPAVREARARLAVDPFGLLRDARAGAGASGVDQ